MRAILAYSETQWDAIKSIVAELGVDVDKVAWPYDEAGRPVKENGVSLRWVLERNLDFYATRERVEAQIPSRKSWIANLTKQRDQIVAVQRSFLAPDLETYTKVNDVLENNAAELAARIDALQLVRSSPSKNARKPGLEMLREHSLRIWMLLGGKPRGVLCGRFLVAALAPVHGTATTKAVQVWLARRNKRKF